MSGVIYVLSACFNIMLPFGFTLGALVVFVWTLPMIVKFIKSIF